MQRHSDIMPVPNVPSLEWLMGHRRTLEQAQADRALLAAYHAGKVVPVSHARNNTRWFNLFYRSMLLR